MLNQPVLCVTIRNSPFIPFLQHIWHNLEFHLYKHCLWTMRYAFWTSSSILFSTWCSSQEVCVDSMCAVQDFPVEHQAQRTLTTSRISFFFIRVKRIIPLSILQLFSNLFKQLSASKQPPVNSCCCRCVWWSYTLIPITFLCLEVRQVCLFQSV